MHLKLDARNIYFLMNMHTRGTWLVKKYRARDTAQLPQVAARNQERAGVISNSSLNHEENNKVLYSSSYYRV